MKIVKGMKVAGYVRVSGKAQVNKGFGLDVQREQITDLCLKHNLEFVELFEDAGISGATMDRPGLQSMIALMPELDAVIVLSTDRLWRDDIVKGVVKKAFMDTKTEVISVDNPNYNVNESEPTEYLVTAILEALDSYQRLEITKKLSRARKKKAQGGNKSSGNCPFGYRYDGKKLVVPVVGEASLVPTFFTSFLEARSTTRLKEMLDAEGVTNRKGKPFSSQALRVILTNDFYVGVVRYGGVKIDGEHKAIVTPELFKRVQRALAKPTRLGRRGMRKVAS